MEEQLHPEECADADLEKIENGEQIHPPAEVDLETLVAQLNNPEDESVAD